MSDPIVKLSEQGAEQGREIAELEGRVDAHRTLLQQDHAPQHGGLHAHPTAVEQSMLKKLSPWRSRWPEVHEFDVQVVELEMQQAQALEDLQRLEDQRRSALAKDAETLGAWELGGRKGDRPEPTLPAIEADIERRPQDLEGLRAAVEQVTDRKAAFVAKHRKRLVADKGQDAREALARYHEAIDAAAAAREELRAARRDELWAGLYPDQLAGQAVPDSLCGGRKRPLRKLGLSAPVNAERVVEALHDDGDWIRGAATQEQYAALHDKHPVQVRPGETTWTNDPKARAERDKVTAEWLSSR